MKNNLTFLTLAAVTLLTLASCAGSRTGYQPRKGYGCPATAGVTAPFTEKNSI